MDAYLYANIIVEETRTNTSTPANRMLSKRKELQSRFGRYPTMLALVEFANMHRQDHAVMCIAHAATHVLMKIRCAIRAYVCVCAIICEICEENGNIRVVVVLLKFDRLALVSVTSVRACTHTRTQNSLNNMIMHTLSWRSDFDCSPRVRVHAFRMC